VQQADAAQRAALAEAEAERVRHALEALTTSRTWRWTSPLRRAASRVKRMTHR
jgi:hypothetical protein